MPGDGNIYGLPGRAAAKLRLLDFQSEGTQYVLRFQEKGGKSREIPVWLLLSCFGYSDIGKPKTLWWLSCSYSLHRLLIHMLLLARLARVIP